MIMLVVLGSRPNLQHEIRREAVDNQSPQVIIVLAREVHLTGYCT
jgi:hypothetical protein